MILLMGTGPVGVCPVKLSSDNSPFSGLSSDTIQSRRLVSSCDPEGRSPKDTARRALARAAVPWKATVGVACATKLDTRQAVPIRKDILKTSPSLDRSSPGDCIEKISEDIWNDKADSWYLFE